MSERTEYRVIYWRNGREQSKDGFPEPDINWGAAWHDIHKHEIVRWEKRTIRTGEWVTTDER